MKNLILTLIFASLVSLPLVAENKPLRDPFWPVGYQPPPPPGQEPPAVEPEKPEPVKPQQPQVQPVTREEWKVARKLLKINGYATGQQQDGETTTTTSVVMINLKHYKAGDKVKLTHDKISFVWTVGPINNNSVELIEVSAVRESPGK